MKAMISAAPLPPTKATECDVMLLLEGTFPYVSGGVSSWVNQIIRGFPDLRFGLCFLGSRREDYDKMKYALPDNVVHIEAHYMHEPHDTPVVTRTRGDTARYADALTFHQQLRQPYRNKQTTDELSQALLALTPHLLDGQALDESSFLYSEASWQTIVSQYREHCTDPSFVDYFWTVRIMHAPIWKLAKIADSLIPARCYHTISTGYAGFLGTLLHQKSGRPLILSEHGIYTKERKIDLFQSEWIRDNRGVFEKDASQISYFRDLWIRFFEALGRMCYESAGDIVALYEMNRLRQVSDGAAAERTRSIPNGIDLPRFAALRASRPALPPPIICLIGRVVPIKDVKTFIRAMRTIITLIPDAQGWIAGPEDEDPEYAEECRNIAEGLDLQDRLKFLGFQKVDDLMPQVGLIVLSSISEALPLVLLEGFAAGVPAVSTDVGSCRQLIYGLDEEDRALGAAGAVVGIAEPQALAEAAAALLSDPQRWHAAQRAGIARVERYYTQDMMFAQYRTLYQQAMAADASSTGAATGCPVRK